MVLEEALAELDLAVPVLEAADIRIVRRYDDVQEHNGPALCMCGGSEFDNAEITPEGIRVLPHITALYAEAGLWCFSRWEYCPGPGPGDFVVKSLFLPPLLPKVTAYYRS